MLVVVGADAFVVLDRRHLLGQLLAEGDDRLGGLVAVFLAHPRHVVEQRAVVGVADHMAAPHAAAAGLRGGIEQLGLILAAEALDPARHVLPVNGTREALFAFTQAVVDRNANGLVVSPNQFYQIYEGAALLAGAEPVFLVIYNLARFRAGRKLRNDVDDLS